MRWYPAKADLADTLRDLLWSPVTMDPNGRMSEDAERSINQHLARHGMRVARDAGDKRPDVSGPDVYVRLEPAYDVGDVIALRYGEATVVAVEACGLGVQYRSGTLALVPFSAPLRVIRRAHDSR